jgi:serine/threonine-protein kinase
VLDFGVSKLLPAAVTALGSQKTTSPHARLGSPVYSSPEQLCEPHNVDARADVWALGAILYELVAGRPPFKADTVVEVCAQVVRAQVEPLHRLHPEVTSELEAVVARCLAKDREHRFASVLELAEALAPFAPRPPMTSVAAIPSAAPPANACTTGRRRVPRSRAIVWCLATSVAAALLGGLASSTARLAGPEAAAPGVPEVPYGEGRPPTPTLDPMESVPSEPTTSTPAASAAPAPTTSPARPSLHVPPPRSVDVRLRPKRVAPPVTANR